jgi:hypothetical protein
MLSQTRKFNHFAVLSHQTLDQADRCRSARRDGDRGTSTPCGLARAIG